MCTPNKRFPQQNTGETTWQEDKAFDKKTCVRLLQGADLQADKKMERLHGEKIKHLMREYVYA